MNTSDCKVNFSEASLDSFAVKCFDLRKQIVYFLGTMKFQHYDDSSFEAASLIYDHLMITLQEEEKVMQILNIKSPNLHTEAHKAIRRDLFSLFTLHDKSRKYREFGSGFSKILSSCIYGHVVRYDNVWFDALHRRILLNG